MLKNKKNQLVTLWAIFSISSLINVLILYWIPTLLPIGSYCSVYLAGISFIEKRYYLFVISLLICIVLLLTTFSIKKDRLFLPILSLVYILFDLLIVFYRFVLSLSDGIFILFIGQLVVLTTLTVLLCKYCWRRLLINNKV